MDAEIPNPSLVRLGSIQVRNKLGYVILFSNPNLVPFFESGGTNLFVAIFSYTYCTLNKKYKIIVQYTIDIYTFHIHIEEYLIEEYLK